MLEEGGDGEEAYQEAGQKFTVVENTIKERTELLEVVGRRNMDEDGNLGSIWANTNRNGVTEKIGVGETDLRFLSATAQGCVGKGSERRREC